MTAPTNPKCRRIHLPTEAEDARRVVTELNLAPAASLERMYSGNGSPLTVFDRGLPRLVAQEVEQHRGSGANWTY
ncbi:hypothetical protein IU453_26130 [Nocardia cyriacigeorgica]|uniref:hypothetical protein n=1 Tax=Nocardia cyriacigeorgica TaxID=135487 RepID=UPI00189313AC|nr:hypothetical protein [Nocardia cyriacigeorgica]MBF6320234.1 hypothetical protein [Nocardia cyriacigeorgica]MBF6534280.1 hypothetical protein [Nocardia cyriacigeorgica]